MVSVTSLAAFCTATIEPDSIDSQGQGPCQLLAVVWLPGLPLVKRKAEAICTTNSTESPTPITVFTTDTALIRMPYLSR